MTNHISVCRLCGSDLYTQLDSQVLNGAVYNICRCAKCSLVYVRETYAEVSPDYVSTQVIDEHRIWLQGKHKEAAFRQCLKAACQLLETGQGEKRQLKMLDIGCGTGGWLEFVKSEFDCYGFDASAAQVGHAQKRFPNVRCATSISLYMAQLDHDPGSFDFITMWDVLEHIRNPLPFVHDVIHRLAPGGVLYISVPAAFPMVMKSKIGRFWPYFNWCPHEHVAYYSPKTLSILAEILGLQVLRYRCL